ncbi:MAG TPA: PVC-type heme-binding CxxCH protein [Verrucomicrobiales bacterium]|nr:PVC-type heme-binding CxxCH protein [Verrucomicrobiales bacterium]
MRVERGGSWLLSAMGAVGLGAGLVSGRADEGDAGAEDKDRAEVELRFEPVEAEVIRFEGRSESQGRDQQAAVAELWLIDASTGEPVAREGWTVRLVSSEDGEGGHGADRAFDGRRETYWLTSGSTEPPHVLEIDLGGRQRFSALRYLPRQDGAEGRIQEFAFFAGNAGEEWGVPLRQGVFGSVSAAATRTGIDPRSEEMRLRRSVFAGSDQVHGPVALTVDDRGRVYVAETYRYEGRGVVDNRGKARRERDDLQTETLEDRRRFLLQWLEDGELAAEYAKRRDLFSEDDNLLTKFSEKVALLEDLDGDGRADRRRVFAEGFNDLLDGPAAGVLTGGGAVYFACVPQIWKLTDSDGDGVADQREVLARGFGVRSGWFGHDLHGLTWGPDGRLYFSVGDRGYHTTAEDGSALHGPGRGAVFRCWPDGSGLELFATGLRNPQELAFDSRGNLFTADNNCDAGDLARIVWVVEGGDSGWDMSVQSLETRGPWMQERMWEMPEPGGMDPPAWVLPPVGHLSEGPSGLAYYPGTGLPEDYQGRFFLCDYRGGRGLVLAFSTIPHGSGFRLRSAEAFDDGPAVSDLAFGPEGRIYVAEWGPGWDINPRAQIYTLEHEPSRATALAREVGEILRKGFAGARAEALSSWLGHADQRVRMGAQFELAGRGEIAALTAAVRAGMPLEARLHGLWGLGQAAARWPNALEPVTGLLGDGDPEMRAQACRLAGEHRLAAAAEGCLALLGDVEPRVRFFAAIALGRIGDRDALSGLVELLRVNEDGDPFLRHAAVVGLSKLNRADDMLEETGGMDSPAVRLGVVLTLRRLHDPRLAQFLNDPDSRVSTEAARAIYDEEIAMAWPALAAGIDGDGAGERPEAFLRRSLESNLRLGREEDAERLARFAVSEAPTEARAPALQALLDWDSPPPREGVWGRWRPAEERSVGVARAAVRRYLPELHKLGDEELRIRVSRLEALYGEERPPEELVRLATDPASPELLRLDALQTLERRGEADALERASKEVLAGPGPSELRAEARRSLVLQDPAGRVRLLEEALDPESPLRERQEAIKVLAALSAPGAVDLLAGLMKELENGELDEEIGLDVLEAARIVPDNALQQQALTYAEGLRAEVGEQGLQRLALHGGDAGRGRQIFQTNSAVQCVRCHSLAGKGGRIGPALDGVAARSSAEGLLVSLVEPQADVVMGFGAITLTMRDGEILTGTLLREEEGEVELAIDQERRLIPAAEIRDRTRPVSGMPPVGALLTPRELRDLMAYLKSLG